MLTVEKLKAMQPKEIFAKGETTDDEKGINIWTTWTKIHWVAVRGDGFHDWAVYIRGSWNWLWIGDYSKSIAATWDKCPKSQIRKILEVDDEAFALYRI